MRVPGTPGVPQWWCMVRDIDPLPDPTTFEISSFLSIVDVSVESFVTRSFSFMNILENTTGNC